MSSPGKVKLGIMTENGDGAAEQMQAGGDDLDARYTVLMTQVAALDREALREFGMNIGLLEGELAGTARTASKKVRDRIEETLAQVEDEAAELRSVTDMLKFLAPQPATTDPHPQHEMEPTANTVVQEGGSGSRNWLPSWRPLGQS